MILWVVVSRRMLGLYSQEKNTRGVARANNKNNNNTSSGKGVVVFHERVSDNDGIVLLVNTDTDGCCFLGLVSTKAFPKQTRNE